MKKILILFSIVAILFSCEDDLSKLNEDPKSATKVEPEVLFSYGQFNMVKQLVNGSYNHNVDRFWANFLTQTTYTEECNYDPGNRDIGGSLWDNIYTESLLELSKSKELVRAEEVADALLPIKKNKLAMITVMEVFGYQYLVDNFGDIPFTEALDIGNITPKYDDAQTIYMALGDSLTAAIADFNAAEAGFSSSADLLYGGDVVAWQKFANSLLFKMGLRIADADNATASSWVNSAISGGVFTSNSDNAIFAFSGTQPYTNPIYSYFVIDNRNTDFVAVQEFLDIIQGVSDPRIDAFFDDNIAAGYIGGAYGAKGNTYTNLSHVNPAISDDPEFPGTIMDYSSISFGLAEAVERGFISGTAATYYQDGINASMESWGISSADAATYSARADVDYATATGTWKQKIGLQKYIASYNQGHEAWTEARRLDYPALLPAAATGRANPFRLTYPTEEVLINKANYDAASAAMGGDELTTKLFWDKN